MAKTKRITPDDLVQPTTFTCAQCGSESVHIPTKQPKKFRGAWEWMAWATEAAKGMCPHCTPLSRDKWPEWLHGRLFKSCGCGSAACPVPAFAAQRGA